MTPKFSIGQRLWRKWIVQDSNKNIKRIEFDYPASIKEIHIINRKKCGKIITEVEYMLGGGLDDIVQEHELYTTEEKRRFELNKAGIKPENKEKDNE